MYCIRLNILVGNDFIDSKPSQELEWSQKEPLKIGTLPKLVTSVCVS